MLVSIEVSLETRRSQWVERIAELSHRSASFGDAFAGVLTALRAESEAEGLQGLLQHLHTCGAVPESYAHDSSAEKLYSKYTDAVVSESLTGLGLDSVVIQARADAADVQARCPDYSLVADAKAFRLSRTAKNQKDFKVQAMDGWRGSLDYAVVIGPIYQFLPRSSQIYKQAVSRNVCLLSFSHLACLISLSERQGKTIARNGLFRILETVNLLHPSKSAADYWAGINRALMVSLGSQKDLWQKEKRTSLEGFDVAKHEARKALVAERDRLLGLSRREALEELVRKAGIESRIKQVNRLAHGDLLEVADSG